tara:strand:- start:5107 stop:5301 length:195 start_codon:yes stop_codon:yes gene_type:complete
MNKQTKKNMQLWTPGEVARFYGYSVGTIAEWRKSGKIPCILLSTGEFRYDIEAVRSAMEVDYNG